jgi:hypothetical protein
MYLGLGGTREQEIGKRLHNVELHDMNMSPNAAGVIKSTTDLWTVWPVWGTGEVHGGFW